MPLDTNVFNRLQTFDDYRRADEEFMLKKQLQAAQINELNRKSMELDVDKLGQQAFIKAAQGLPITPQESAALQYLDAKSPTAAFNPVTGVMETKPSLLDRAGLPVVKPGATQPSPSQTSMQGASITQPVAGGNAPFGRLTPKSNQVLQEKRIAQQVEREAGYTKAQSALQGLETQGQIVNKAAQDALALIDKPYSAATGWPSIVTGGGFLPGDRRQLDNYLNTIKANVGFDKLQQMRENSPTGGALGQVSDFENRLLQAINGALDPLQGEQLKENLSVINNLYPQVLAERRRAFEQDYGTLNPIGDNKQNSPAPSNVIPQAPKINKSDAINELRRRGKL